MCGRLCHVVCDVGVRFVSTKGSHQGGEPPQVHQANVRGIFGCVFEELLDELPPRRQVDHVIEVMPGVAPPPRPHIE